MREEEEEEKKRENTNKKKCGNYIFFNFFVTELFFYQEQVCNMSRTNKSAKYKIGLKTLSIESFKLEIGSIRSSLALHLTKLVSNSRIFLMSSSLQK